MEGQVNNKDQIETEEITDEVRLTYTVHFGLVETPSQTELEMTI